MYPMMNNLSLQMPNFLDPMIFIQNFMKFGGGTSIFNGMSSPFGFSNWNSGFNNMGYGFNNFANYNSYSSGFNTTGGSSASSTTNPDKTKCNNLKRYLLAYAAYKNGNTDIKARVNEAVKTGTEAEKVTKLQEIYNSVSESEKLEFMTSDKFDSSINLSDSKNLKSSLEKIGLRESSSITYTEEKAKIDKIKKGESATLDITDNNILNYLSTYHNGTHTFAEDIKTAYTNSTNNKEAIKEAAEDIKQKLITEAKAQYNNMTDGDAKTEFKKQYEALENSDITDEKFAEKFNRVYAYTRIIAAKAVSNQLNNAMGLTDDNTVITKTTKDLEDEKLFKLVPDSIKNATVNENATAYGKAKTVYAKNLADKTADEVVDTFLNGTQGNKKILEEVDEITMSDGTKTSAYQTTELGSDNITFIKEGDKYYKVTKGADNKYTKEEELKKRDLIDLQEKTAKSENAKTEAKETEDKKKEDLQNKREEIANQLNLTCVKTKINNTTRDIYVNKDTGRMFYLKEKNNDIVVMEFSNLTYDTANNKVSLKAGSKQVRVYTPEIDTDKLEKDLKKYAYETPDAGKIEKAVNSGTECSPYLKWYTNDDDFTDAMDLINAMEPSTALYFIGSFNKENVDCYKRNDYYFAQLGTECGKHRKEYMTAMKHSLNCVIVQFKHMLSEKKYDDGSEIGSASLRQLEGDIKALNAYKNELKKYSSTDDVCGIKFMVGDIMTVYQHAGETYGRAIDDIVKSWGKRVLNHQPVGEAQTATQTAAQTAQS